jgi:hypothetical protein
LAERHVAAAQETTIELDAEPTGQIDPQHPQGFLKVAFR